MEQKTEILKLKALLAFVSKAYFKSQSNIRDAAPETYLNHFEVIQGVELNKLLRVFSTAYEHQSLVKLITFNELWEMLSPDSEKEK